jgi:pullulanase
MKALRTLLSGLGLAFALLLGSCGGGDQGADGRRFALSAAAANVPAETQEELYQFFAIAFGAAPGVTYWGQLVEAAQVGMSVQRIVNVFTTKAQFTDTYPEALSHEAFARALVDNVVGDSASEASKAEARADIVAALSPPANWTRGDITYAIFRNLARKPASDAQWAATAQRMRQQVTLARHFTETMQVDTTDLSTLRAVIRSVNEGTDLSGDLSTLVDSALGGGTQHAVTLRAVPSDADGVASATPGPATAMTVHYRRSDGQYSGWQIHTWNAARDPGWNQGWAPARLDSLGAVFAVPVAAGCATVGYLFHKGDTKDHGNRDQAWTLVGGANEIWRVQGDDTTYTAEPGSAGALPAGTSNLREARAVWLNRQLLQWPAMASGSGTYKLYASAAGQVRARVGAAVNGHDAVLSLQPFTGTVPAEARARFGWVGGGAVLSVAGADLPRLPELHRRQLVLVQEDSAGRVLNATTTQTPGALDELFGAAAEAAMDAGVELGATVAGGATHFRLWAPTAQRVSLFTYASSTGAAASVDEMQLDPTTGIWSTTRPGNLNGTAYRYGVDVFVRGVGLVRNLVTDPYALALTANSQRSVVADLNAAALKPAGWDASAAPPKVAAAPDMSIYELHVRDFSASDATVSAPNRGKYLAFTETSSNGMKHLKALADAGLSDVHLLPVFDIASIPEVGCTTPAPIGTAASEAQQATVNATRSTDCFNWGYDPWHFTAPEGSYTSDAAAPFKRIIEFRQMVMALHAAGLRVGMDVVYNHTTASGQSDKSVLDRIVPGYYHRLDAAGSVTNSTCCDNTATEHRMMARLMSDSVLTWARDYKISSFRFDIMGHQPRSVMEGMQARVKATLGRDVQFLGEGWNFGEVANGARFVQASLYSLNGSGIGTFNPYLRDAVRGGGCCDSGNALISNQGWINGLHFDPNALGGGRSRTDLMWQADVIKAGLAGSIRSFPLTTHWNANLTLEQMMSGGSPVGYVTEPGEVVNYVENHDNLTLFDNNAFKLPAGTSREDRARVQMLGAALVAFSQGVPYFHAGMETLRSKSLDRNSYDAGDWFNRLDWTYTDNAFGVGLPMASDNESSWGLMRPVLQSSGIKPAPGDIAWARDTFRDLLKIRASTTLLRLRTAEDIKARLRFLNTGSAQVPTVVAARIDGNGYPGSGFKELVYLINTDKVPQTVSDASLAGKTFVLHPVHRAAGAADVRAREAVWEAGTGSFTVPARTAVVFVGE